MSSTKYLTRRKTKKEDICPFFQLSGATLEIFVSWSKKKYSSSTKEGENSRVVILLKKNLCYKNKTFFSKFPPTSWCAVGIRTWRVLFLLTVEEGKTEVEVFHQICVSHHHVKHISGPGLNVTANHHILSIRQHYSHLSLRRTRTSFSGLWWVHTNKHTHGHKEHIRMQVRDTNSGACNITLHKHCKDGVNEINYTM